MYNRFQSCGRFRSGWMICFLVLGGLITTAEAQKKSNNSIPENVSVLQDIEYAKPNDYSLKLDLYRPKEFTGRLPVIVFVHGGGWKNGNKTSAKGKTLWLVEHGFAIASIQYRLTDVAQWPSQIDDCYEAVRFLRKNAEKYQLDPDHIGAWGTSAGGHLVALMGTRNFPDKEEVSSKVQVVCDWFGPTELLTMPPNNIGNGRTADDVAKSNGAKLLGATVREVPEKARDASAIDHVNSKNATFLIMHGEKDPGVPLEQSIKFHAKLLKHNVPATLHIVKGAGHGGPQFNSSESKEVVLRFFTETLKPTHQKEGEQLGWNQGPGPNANFRIVSGNAPTKWSVTRNENIKWKLTLPETGQSTVVVSNGKLFFTTMKPLEGDAEIGQDIIAYCCDAETGKILWQREIQGEHPLRLSGCFSDSSSPPAVTDGQHACFFNASGTIACFDYEGKSLWSLKSMAVGRSQPFLLDGSVVYTKQTYMPEKGHFSHAHKDAPVDQWTQLQAINLATGKVTWTSKCGINMGNNPLPHRINDRPVIFLARGGGHSPPEKPTGVSLIDGTTGETIWTLPLEGFASTQTMSIHKDQAVFFHGGEHLWVDVNTGKITKRVSFVTDTPATVREDDQYVSKTTSLPSGNKGRAIIQQSNLLVGNYHYFRSYTDPFVGRVNVETGKVELLQLPVQLMRSMENESDKQTDQLLWDADDVPHDATAKSSKKKLAITQWQFKPNDMKNSRGFVVMGDKRSMGSGWGHHASAIPTAVGKHLFIPTMSGTVYVLDWSANQLDQNALVAINDLGPIGTAWNRASLSYANGNIFAHTIREVICIGKE